MSPEELAKLKKIYEDLHEAVESCKKEAAGETQGSPEYCWAEGMRRAFATTASTIFKEFPEVDK